MVKVIGITQLKETDLFRHLKTGFKKTEDKDEAEALTETTRAICETAAKRSREFSKHHGQFTLHNETHFLRVCQIMALLLGPNIDRLNPVETSLMIAAAYWHDQGMIPDAEDWTNSKASDDYRQAHHAWYENLPALTSLNEQTAKRTLSPATTARLAEAEAAFRSDFLRRRHGPRAKDLVTKLLGNQGKYTLGKDDLAPTLGLVCASHVKPAAELTDKNGFYTDATIGQGQVNLQFLAVILRLADILDFDKDRAPQPILDAITFTSQVSVAEWEKHRAVNGWEITEHRIRFTMACTHPAYQKAAYDFMNAIDHELAEAHRIIDGFPKTVPDHHRLMLPQLVDRERIQPKDNAYEYADLSISLAKNELTTLLLGEGLYNHSFYFVRELIQNSLDALRLRKALYAAKDYVCPGGEISLSHHEKDGRQVLRCTDNGAGMDRNQIERYLTKIGKSYYDSWEFKTQVKGFAKHDADFTPCAQFGIGFASCFMFGDRITIHTRRDNGPEERHGVPLVIDIDGVNSILVIRKGSPDQPVGTTVDAIGPPKPLLMSRWNDRVRLLDVLNEFILAAEFPITAHVTIDEIKGEQRREPGIDQPKSQVERHGLIQTLIIDESIDEPHYTGCVRIGLLKDDDGRPTLSNTEARLDIVHRGPAFILTDDNKSKSVDHLCGSVCADGIRIGGGSHRLEHPALGTYNFPGNGPDPFIIDVRGPHKPEITPARNPVRIDPFSIGPGWWETSQAIKRARARAWQRVAAFQDQGLSPDDFIKLALAFDAPLASFDATHAFEYLALPLTIGDQKHTTLVPLRDVAQATATPLNTLGVEHDDQQYTVGLGDDLSAWARNKDGWQLKTALLRFGTLSDVQAGTITIGRHTQNDTLYHLRNFRLQPIIFVNNTILGAIYGNWSYLNRNHPLVLAHLNGPADHSARTNLQVFIASLIALVGADWIVREAAANGSATHHDSLVRDGRYFAAVRHQLSDDLKPPYSIWLADHGMVTITAESLERWAAQR